MIKTILTTAAVSLALTSGAWALSASPGAQSAPVANSDLIEVGNRYHGKWNRGRYSRHHHHGYRRSYGYRSYGYRSYGYRHRPYANYRPYGYYGYPRYYRQPGINLWFGF